MIVVLNCVQALWSRFTKHTGSGGAFVDREISRISGIWDAIQRNCPAAIVQSNFVLPYIREFGNFVQKQPDSFYSCVLAMNARIAESGRSRTGVLINDVESVASWAGRSNWFDDRLWDLAKSYCALEQLPAAARNIAEIVLASRGRVAKCVVLDLDNTVWGGVIGDDGLDGIRLNAHGDGECFYRLQCYLKDLQRRGVLLAVCSKNDHHNAVLPFEKHPEMVLKREDITVFVANWNDKAANIKLIRETLNIGYDSMIFLDDNPFERNLVRDLVPGIIVPELPEDPADYVKFLSELNLFETTAFSVEDANRAELYRHEAERRLEQASYASVDDFLRSLDMRITVARFDSFHLPRIAQLLQRSNQFNLTTNRYTEAQCEALMNDDGVIPLYAKLSDRLGDHGLISVIVLRPEVGSLRVVDWLMSCRVLVRGVEQYLMNETVGHARRLGLSRIMGEFIPTPKNGMVKEFFAQFGFRKIEESVEGRSLWSMEVDSYTPATVFIAPAESAQTAQINT